MASVLTALAEVPYGETVSYKELTLAAGLDPAQVREVGAALGRNPLAIVLPCHRVIGSDGSLVGFGGGLERKRRLLDLEAPQLTLAVGGGEIRRPRVLPWGRGVGGSGLGTGGCAGGGLRRWKYPHGVWPTVEWALMPPIAGTIAQ